MTIVCIHDYIPQGKLLDMYFLDDVDFLAVLYRTLLCLFHRKAIGYHGISCSSYQMMWIESMRKC